MRMGLIRDLFELKMIDIEHEQTEGAIVAACSHDVSIECFDEVARPAAGAGLRRVNYTFRFNMKLGMNAVD